MSKGTVEDINTVAVVGTGTIGSSWTALFLAHDLDVVVYDPEPGAEVALAAYVDRVRPDLMRLGATGNGQLAFAHDMAEAVQQADFVQENGPENEALKIDILAELDSVAPAHAVIATSTSALLLSAITAKCKTPERIVAGHPFNPPHLIPLVEITGVAPDAEAVLCADAFYRSVGRQTVILSKEAIGHIANRLNAAIWREAISIYQQGIATPEEIDRAFSAGPGLRWAINGPFKTYHLGGGQGGIRQFMKHLQPAHERRWADMGTPKLDDDLRMEIADRVIEMIGDRSIADLETERDRILLALIEAMDPD